MPGTKNSGNSSSRRGKPTVRRIRLTKEAASKLRLLLAQRNTLRQQMSEAQLVEELIEREWRELDEGYATT